MDADIGMARVNQPPAVRWARRWSRPLLGAYWLALAVGTHWPGLDLGVRVAGGVIQYDKIAHALAFTGLTWLLILARPLGRGAGRGWTALAALLIAAAYALVDEWTQPWFERTAAASDLVAGLIGVAGAYLTATAGGVSARWRAWPIYLARALWLVLTPALALLALSQGGNATLVDIYQALGWPIYEADLHAHFVLGAALTWLLAAGAPAGGGRPRLSAAVTVIIMAASAPVLELAQRTTGRGFEILDVWYHMLGLLTGLGVWALLPISTTVVPPLWRATGPAGERGDAAHPSRFVGHALLVGAMTLVSRLTGLVRDAVLAAAFGLGAVADAFFIGFLVPNLFRRLFGEGALTAAFIPHYTDLIKSDPATARRFASLCVGLLAIVLAVITLAGEGVLYLMAQRGWGENTLLAIRLTMIMLPYMPLICLVALLGGMLQVHGRFGPPAAAPVLLNLTMIGFTLWGTQGVWHDNAMPHVAVVVALSVVVAGVLQLLWQGAALYRAGAPFTRHVAGTATAFRSMLWMMLPMLFGLAVFQINAFLDSLIAYALAPRNGATSFTLFGRVFDYPIETGAVAALQWAQRLYQFPLGVFGIAVATAIFPALAHAAADPDDPDNCGFATILRHGLRLTVFIGLPASVGLILLRLPLTRLIYERGAFTGEDAARVATILAGYAASVWAYSMMHVLTRAFYARKDARTPLRISVGMVVVNLGLNVALIWPLGAAGLAWSTAISGAAQVALLLVAVRRYVAQPIDAEVLRGWGRTAALTAVMAVVLVPMLAMWEPAALSAAQNAALLAAAVAVGMAVVLGGAWVTGAPELDWLRRRRAA